MKSLCIGIMYIYDILHLIMTKAEFNSFLSVMTKIEQEVYISNVYRYNKGSDLKSIVKIYAFNIFVFHQLIDHLIPWDSPLTVGSPVHWSAIKARYGHILNKK